MHLCFSCVLIWFYVLLFQGWLLWNWKWIAGCKVYYRHVRIQVRRIQVPIDITLEDRLMTVIRWISKRGGDFARQRTLRVPWERQKPSHTWNSSNSFCQTCNWHSAGNGKSNYWRITSCQTQKDCKVLLSTCEILDVASWCKSTILCAAVYHPICSVDPHALGLKTSNISWLVTELGLLSVPFLLVVCFCKFGRYTSCVCC